MSSCIYGIFHPVTDELRYVGQTIDWPNRAMSHWKRKRCREHKDKFHTWIRKILAMGLIPVHKILEECESNSLSDTEIFWIASVKSTGAKLLNMTDGGEATHGYHHSPERRKKISDVHRGKVIPPEIRITMGRKGVTHSRELSEKRGAKLRNRKVKFVPPSRKGVKYGPGYKNRFIIIDDFSGIVYTSARDASRKLSIAYGTVKGLLKGKRTLAYPELKLRMLNV